MKRYIFGIGVLLLFSVLPAHSALAAIAVDGTAGSNISGTSLTYSHTVTSSDHTVLFVGISGDNVDNISSVTYDGVSMNLIRKHISGSSWLWLYGLLAPTVGTHDVTVTFATSQNIRAVSVSYSGVNQDLTLDSIGDTQNSNDGDTSLTSTTTSVADNSWMIVLGGFQRPPSAGTNSTQRVLVDNATVFYDSNGVISPAGNYSMTYNFSSCISGCMASVFATIAPAGSSTTTPPTSITGSGTTNMLAKFTGSTSIGNALFSDDGSNTTLTAGNLFIPVNSIIDSISSGALNFGTVLATTMTFGRSGQDMVINSNLGIGTSTPSTTLQVNGGFLANSSKVGTMGTISDCVSSTSPAVCGSAPAGSIALSNGESTLIVDTTAVTANSQIFINEDSSLGTRLGITCNTGTGRNYVINARVSGTSFTVKSSANPVTHKACLSYLIVN
jgi:hypothetical protein